MLATSEIAGIVADFLLTLPRSTCPVVLDPILRSSSGAELLDPAGIRLLRSRLLPLATVVTPNRSEAALLTGLPGSDVEAMARCLRRLGAAAAVVTGGDATGGDATPGDATGGDATRRRNEWGCNRRRRSQRARHQRPRPAALQRRARLFRRWHGAGRNPLRAPYPIHLLHTEPAAPFPPPSPARSPADRMCPTQSPQPRPSSAGLSSTPPGLGHGNGPMGLERAGKA